MSRRRTVGTKCWVAIALALGCSDKPGLPTDTAVVEEVPGTALNHLAWIATHNSYWVDRGVPDDLFAGGVGLNLVDQVLAYGVHGLEIDIHRSRTTPGEFDVYHTVPGNSLCATLRDCLRILRGLGVVVPNHLPIVVVLEFKEILEPFFTAGFTPPDLDRLLREELQERIFEPKDLLARCPGATTLVECTRTKGWPSAETLRGRILFATLGNWDEIGDAANTSAWAEYATYGRIHDRAAFPMASSWKLRYEDLPVHIQREMTREQLDDALSQSVFLQIEDLADARLQQFLVDGGIVRAGGPDTVTAQAEKVAAGVQMLQTDFPWEMPDGLFSASPFTATSNLPAPQVRGCGRAKGSLSTANLRLYTWPNSVTSGPVVLYGSGAACLVVGSSLGPWTGVCRRKQVTAPTDREAARNETVECSSSSACERSGVTARAQAEFWPEAVSVVRSRADGETCVEFSLLEMSTVDVGTHWRPVLRSCHLPPTIAFGILIDSPEDASRPRWCAEDLFSGKPTVASVAREFAP